VYINLAVRLLVFHFNAVATGNEVDKAVIIITRRSRCSRRMIEERKIKNEDN
jgi:hypothetical protein